MKKIILIYCFFNTQIGFAQLKTYSMQEVEQLSRLKPKPILVFIHTDWCKYCKMMEQTTLKNQAVIALLNNNYYFVSLNAESKETITYNSHDFVYKPTGISTGIHELAIELASINGQITYPTLTILDTEKNIIFQKNSFLNSKVFLETIKTM